MSLWDWFHEFERNAWERNDRERKRHSRRERPAVGHEDRRRIGADADERPLR